MRQVILQMTVSVDGFVAGPQGGLGGSFQEDEELTEWKLARVRDAGTHIMGRVTYGQMAGFWPTATNAYAESMNKIPKVVFSSTLKETPWARPQRDGLDYETVLIDPRTGTLRGR